MRIIAGEYKGRTLKALTGSTTRPTADRVREALMNSIVSVRDGFGNAVVLDAFAGSGALGLEALSRGADTVTFFERDAKAFRVLRENAASLNLEMSSYALFQADSFKQRPRFSGKAFDLVFLDPPYDTKPDKVLRFLEGLRYDGVLSQDAIIAYEYAKKSDSQLVSALDLLQYEIVSHRSYGDTSIVLLRVCKGVDAISIHSD